MKYIDKMMTSDEVLAAYPRVSTDKDVAALIPWLQKNRSTVAVATYATAKNGKLYKEVQTGGCHAGILVVGPTATLVGTLSCQTDYGISVADKEVARRWFDYLLNGSYYSPFFINNGVDEAMDIGMFVDLGLPTNLVHGACILARASGEKKSYIKCWDWLVREHGIDRDVAFLMTWGTTLHGLASGHLTSPFYATSIGHTPIAALSLDKMKGWLNRTYNNLADQTWVGVKTDGYSYGLASIIPTSTPYGGRDSQTETSSFNEFLNSTVKEFVGGKVASSVASPFGNNSATSQYIMLSEVKDKVVEVINLIVKESQK